MVGSLFSWVSIDECGLFLNHHESPRTVKGLTGVTCLWQTPRPRLVLVCSCSSALEDRLISAILRLKATESFTERPVNQRAARQFGLCLDSTGYLLHRNEAVSEISGIAHNLLCSHCPASWLPVVPCKRVLLGNMRASCTHIVRLQFGSPYANLCTTDFQSVDRHRDFDRDGLEVRRTWLRLCRVRNQPSAFEIYCFPKAEGSVIPLEIFSNWCWRHPPGLGLRDDAA